MKQTPWICLLVLFLDFALFPLLPGGALPAQKLTVQDLVALKKLGYSEGDIQKEVRRAGVAFELTPKAVKALEEGGLSKAFVAFLRGLGGKGTPPAGNALEKILALVRNHRPPEEVLDAILGARGAFPFGAAAEDAVRKAGAPPVVVAACRIGPVSLAELEKLAGSGAGKEALLLLLDLRGNHKENIPPAKALTLVRAGIPPEVLARFRAEKKGAAVQGAPPSPGEGAKTGRKASYFRGMPLKGGTFRDVAGRFTLHLPPGWWCYRYLQDGDPFYSFSPQAGVKSPEGLEKDLEILLQPLEEDSPFLEKDAVTAMEELLPRILLSERGLRQTGKIRAAELGGLPGAMVTLEGTLEGKKGTYKGEFYMAREGRLLYLVDFTAPKGEAEKLDPLFRKVLAGGEFGRKPETRRGGKWEAPDLVKKYKASCLVVNAETGLSGSQGTGFLVDSRGYVLTNWHVIWNAEKGEPYKKITISWDDSLHRPTVQARLVAYAHKLSRQVRLGGVDLALLKIPPTKDKPFPLTPLSQVELGDQVLTMGFPRSDVMSGYSVFVTKGVVVRYNRDLKGRVQSLAMDAKISHGNSGGPCISLATGGVIGLNTWGFNTGGRDINGGKIDDLVGFYFVCPADAARREFPLAVDLHLGEGEGLDFLDLYEIAYLYKQLGSPRAAVSLAEKAVAAGPRSVDALSLLGDARVALAMDLLDSDPAEAEKAAQKAEETYRKALDLDPDHLPSLLSLAQLQVGMDKVEEAERTARRAVEAAPDDWSARLVLAQVLLKRNKGQEAQAALEEAKKKSLGLMPDPYLVSGAAAYARGDYEQGLKDYKKAVSIQPGNFQARMGVGEYFEIKKEWAKAYDYYSGLRARFPGNPLLFFRMGVCLRYQGKDDDALKLYGDALSGFKKAGTPPPADLLLDLGDLFHKKKSLVLEVRFLARFLLYYGRTEKAVEVNRRLGDLWKGNGRNGAASAHYAEALFLARALGQDAPQVESPRENLSLDDLHLLLGKAGYPAQVVAELVLHAPLGFRVTTRDGVADLVHNHHFPPSVIRAILKASKEGGEAAGGANPGGAQPGPGAAPGPGGGGNTVGGKVPSFLVGTWYGSIFIPRRGIFKEKFLIHPDGSFQGIARIGDMKPSKFSGKIRVEGNVLVLHYNELGSTERAPFQKVGPGVIKVYLGIVDQWMTWSRQ